VDLAGGSSYSIVKAGAGRIVCLECVKLVLVRISEEV
jgi:hypothetical protein